MGVFDKLRDSLTRTKAQIVSRFEEIVQQADTEEQRSRPIDVDTIEALEELLISADVGLAATERIVNAVRARARHGESLRDRDHVAVVQGSSFAAPRFVSELSSSISIGPYRAIHACRCSVRSPGRLAKLVAVRSIDR